MSVAGSNKLLTELAQILSTDPDYPIDRTLLYAEVGDRYVSASIFKLHGNHIIYRWPMNAINRPLLDLWVLEPPAKRWEEIEYLIKDGRFEVTYTYPDEIDRNEEPMDRRARIVARFFGDKPIVYPGFPTAADELRYKL